MSAPKAFDCVDCNVNTLHNGEYYMLRDEVWEATGLSSGMLCVGCAEHRLGRRLRACDFADALINVPGGVPWNPQSVRLLNRLLSV